MESMINLIVNVFLIIGLIVWIEEAGHNYNRSLEYNYKYEFNLADYVVVGFISTYWILTFLQAFSQDIR